VLVTTFLTAFSVQSQENGRPQATIDFSLYPYQHTLDNDVDFTTMINARLPGWFAYFSYVNMNGATTGESFAFDRSEQNLRYSVSDQLPLDLNLQGVFARGDGNDFYQLGIGWRVHNTPGWQEFFSRIKLIYRMTIQLRRFEVADTSSWALEHWFRMSFPQVSDRLYLMGSSIKPSTRPCRPRCRTVRSSPKFSWACGFLIRSMLLASTGRISDGLAMKTTSPLELNTN
jgi:hypothetical protein